MKVCTYRHIILLFALIMPFTIKAQSARKHRNIDSTPVAESIHKILKHPRIKIARPVRPGKNYYWRESEWVWTDGAYEWSLGGWELRPKHHTWQNGHWKRVKGGYHWVPGRWK